MISLITWFMAYILTAAILLLSAAYIFFTPVYSYFKKRRIPFESGTFPLGSLWPVFRVQKSYTELMFDMYNKHRGEKFVGFFQFFRKSVLVIDPDLLRNVLVKDFEYFDGKSLHYNRELEPLTAHLFALDGQEWKALRAKIAPAFSSGKLKGMFQVVLEVGEKLREYTFKTTAENEELECKDLFLRYGLAIIASTAFGIESDVLSDKSSTFFEMAESITAPTLSAMFRMGLMMYGGNIAKMFNLRILPKESHEFFFNLAKDTVTFRETHEKTRQDIMQLLMQLLKQEGKNADEGMSITIEELAAQTFVFILAGYETTSTSMSFFLYEMAMNPEVQARVHAEVDSVEEISYDTLAGMEYLDMALDETLRKHVPLGFLSRVCSKDYPVPGTNHIIEKGTDVVISVTALHHDPELFPEPDQFLPERFSKENKSNIRPFSYMPFGEGPRFCIGLRLGKLSVKAGLAKLMKQFSIETTPRTPNPLKYDARTINTVAAGGMWLRLVDRTKS
uniref:Cytochrome P450 n=1 Tax=Graphocephala atropunctata TaxID=36148 RepID=A0A1B6MFF0_9HEMI